MLLSIKPPSDQKAFTPNYYYINNLLNLVLAINQKKIDSF